MTFKKQKQHKEDFLYTDLTISKKWHNSGTPVPNLTKEMSCTVTLYKVHVYQLSYKYFDNCGISIRLKKQRKDDLSPVFAISPRYLNIVGNTDYQNLT